MDKQTEFVLRAMEERDVRFVRLWFTLSPPTPAARSPHTLVDATTVMGSAAPPDVGEALVELVETPAAEEQPTTTAPASSRTSPAASFLILMVILPVEQLSCGEPRWAGGPDDNQSRCKQ